MNVHQSSSVETRGSTAWPRHHTYIQKPSIVIIIFQFSVWPAAGKKMPTVDNRSRGWPTISPKTEKLESRRREFYGTLGARGPPDAPPFCKPMSPFRCPTAADGKLLLLTKSVCPSESHRVVTHSLTRRPPSQRHIYGSYDYAVREPIPVFSFVIQLLPFYVVS